MKILNFYLHLNMLLAPATVGISDLRDVHHSELGRESFALANLKSNKYQIFKIFFLIG